MDNSIRDMGDLLRIKNEIDRKLPRFDVEKVLISLSENCGANQLQYSMEQEFYKFEQMYLTKCEMEINMTPLGQNNYTELKDAFEYELNDIRNKVQEIPQTEEWNKLVRLVREREELNNKIDEVSHNIDLSEKPKKKKDNSDGKFAAGAIAVIGAIIVGCMAEMGREDGNIGEALQAATCFIVPTVIAIIYLIVSFSSATQIEKSEEEYNDKISQRSTLYDNKSEINMQIRNVIGEISSELDGTSNHNGSGGIIY